MNAQVFCWVTLFFRVIRVPADWLSFLFIPCLRLAGYPASGGSRPSGPRAMGSKSQAPKHMARKGAEKGIGMLTLLLCFFARFAVAELE